LPILSPTYRIGGLQCLWVWVTQTTWAVYRQPSLTTHEHRLYVNPNRMIREFHRKTAGRVIPRDFELTIKEQEPCRGQQEFELIYTMISNA
jgi:hypothetical protein